MISAKLSGVTFTELPPKMWWQSIVTGSPMFDVPLTTQPTEVFIAAVALLLGVPWAKASAAVRVRNKMDRQKLIPRDRLKLKLHAGKAAAVSARARLGPISAQIFVKEFEGTRPRLLCRLFVVTRCCVVVEPVLFTVVHVNLIHLLVRL